MSGVIMLLVDERLGGDVFGTYGANPTNSIVL